jgi:prefoldin alpha subunit
MSGGEEELQQLSQQLQAVESQLESLQVEIQNLRTRQRDIDEAIEAIDALETGSTVQVPVGGGAYVRATIDDVDEVIVGIGADYAAERDQDGAVSLLSERKDNIDDRLSELTDAVAQLESQGEELSQEAQQRLQRLQAERGGLGGAGGGLPGGNS